MVCLFLIRFVFSLARERARGESAGLAAGGRMKNYFSSRKGKGAGNGEYKQKQATAVAFWCRRSFINALKITALNGIENSPSRSRHFRAFN